MRQLHIVPSPAPAGNTTATGNSTGNGTTAAAEPAESEKEKANTQAGSYEEMKDATHLHLNAHGAVGKPKKRQPTLQEAASKRPIIPRNNGHAKRPTRGRTDLEEREDGVDEQDFDDDDEDEDENAGSRGLGSRRNHQEGGGQCILS